MPGKNPLITASANPPVNNESVLDVFPDLCLFIGADNHLRHPNRAAARRLGLKRGANTGVHIDDVIIASSRTTMHDAVLGCLQSAAPVGGEAEFVQGDGKIFRATYRLVRYPEDQPDSCLAVIHDSSPELDKDMALLRFESVAHYTVNPLEITDTNGKIVYVNPAFEKASGYSRDELIGKNPNMFGSGKHPKEFWKKMWETITAGEVWVGEIENQRRSGDPYFTQILISPIQDASGKIIGYFGIHRDITQQRHLEQQLVIAQKMESIGMLAAGLAHEVGNPLTSISSLVQIILRTTQDAFITDKLSLIKNQVGRISKIIRELVDFSRHTTYDPVPTDVNKIIAEAVDIVRVGMKAKNIEFNFRLTEPIPAVALVPDKLHQVFINLLINAIDSMEHVRDLPSRNAIELKSFVDANNVSVSICDSGPGIPEDALPKIFDPFFTTKPVGRGTGLGLWVSYTIVKQFGGEIIVESVLDKGTTFTVSFPIIP